MALESSPRSAAGERASLPALHQQLGRRRVLGLIASLAAFGGVSHLLAAAVAAARPRRPRICAPDEEAPEPVLGDIVVIDYPDEAIQLHRALQSAP